MAPGNWPDRSKLTCASDQMTLVTFIHPACPCSMASIEELARIQAHCGERLKFYVVFVWSGGSSQLDASMTYRSSIANPGFESVVDRDTSEARAFGAQTSGHAFLFARDGRLVFDGGITGARGHSGDNLGQMAIEEWVFKGRSDTIATPVFGCGLLHPSESGLEGAR
ncbi:MAG: RedB protein [Phycisphaerae bacterium]|nr:RedB protein [Phycisphaerae bacterium]